MGDGGVRCLPGCVYVVRCEVHEEPRLVPHRRHLRDDALRLRRVQEAAVCAVPAVRLATRAVGVSLWSVLAGVVATSGEGQAED